MIKLSLSAIIVASIGCQTTGNRLASQGSDEANGGNRSCQAVQDKISLKYAGPSVGISVDLARNCTVAIFHQSPRAMLSIVDQMIKNGDNPLLATERGRPIALKHEVIGDIFPHRGQPGSVTGADPENLGTNQTDVCEEVVKIFESGLGNSAYERFGINGIGFGAMFDGRCSILAGFESPKGYRNFVKHMVDNAMDPTYFRTKLNDGKLVQMYIDAHHVEAIVPQPVVGPR